MEEKRKKKIIQARQLLIKLNSNKQQGMIMFWASLILGAVVGIIISLMVFWAGFAVFSFVMALLGVSGLITWINSSKKIKIVQAELLRLEEGD